ncbi:hypothetical protein, partial [Desulfobacter sp.]|uniref:hypothetical protein n=1 Tax=Desulfobacter sp. TaxID=2294 RepID=UPI003D14DB96
INQKLKEIPARIAENQEMDKEAKAPDQNDKTLFDKKLSDLQDCLAQERNSEIISSKRVELNEVNAAILKERSRVDELNREGKKPILDAIDALEKEKRENANHVESLKDSLDRDKKRNATAKEAIEKVRDDYRIEFAKQPTGDTTCPTCGQELPFDQIEVTNETFNKVKAKRLEKINQEGKQLKAGIEAREKEISEIKAKIQDLNSTLQYLEIEIEKYRKKLSDIKSVEIDTSDLDQKKSIIESEIRALQNGSATRERDISGKITEISAKISGWEKQSAEYNAAEKARDRIKDLEKQEKDLSAEYEALEKELFLSEQFIVRKVEMLEESINSRFNLARFKLFETQVNGGLKECCEILYQGVPFDRGLNNAARVNVGIDIINTLSDYFQFQAPIFCDNAESVNVLADTSAQVLGLYVSEHEALTMEKLEVKQAS